MNRREHLIRRIERALEADEDDITDLTQRVDWLEREVRRWPLRDGQAWK